MWKICVNIFATVKMVMTFNRNNHKASRDLEKSNQKKERNGRSNPARLYIKSCDTLCVTDSLLFVMHMNGKKSLAHRPGPGLSHNPWTTAAFRCHQHWRHCHGAIKEENDIALTSNMQNAPLVSVRLWRRRKWRHVGWVLWVVAVVWSLAGGELIEDPPHTPLARY